ncbi:MAG: histidine kinase dimerization/phospho-acceptor domain-containing protein, partial [Luminiphilus sp.]
MSKTVEYALYGALFGAMFPLISTVFDLLVQGLPLTLSNALQLQRSQPLHWVIDSAPLFLGLFAGLAGRRQDTVIAKVQQLTSLNQRLQQEQKNLADLAGGLQQLFENMPLGAAAFGQDNVLLSANDAFQRFVAGDQGIQQALDHHIAVLDSDQMSRDIKLESGESAKYAMVWRVDLPGLGDTRYWVLLNDQTAQKVSEAQLKMTSKLATLGELAAGTAHELNQPLNHIKLLAANMTNIMKRSPADLDALQAKVEAVSASTTRAGKIIAHMLSFGRSTSDRMQPMFVGTAIEAALGLLQHQFT